MSFWATELTAAGRASYAEEADALGAKNERVYRRLTLYIARIGSAPGDDRSLGEIAGVTASYFRNRAWPLLQDIFEIRGDRLYHPAIERGAPPQSKRADPARSDHGRKAARSRWDGQPNLSLVQDASERNDGHAGNAHEHASGMHADAQLPEKSMPDASKIHAENARFDARFASSGMPGASSRARAPSPSSEDSSFTESPQNQRESFGERENARTGDDAHRDAQVDASGMHSDAHEHANGHADARKRHRSGRPRAPAATVPIASDWAPSEASGREALKRGYDPAEVAVAFRDHYTANGQSRADWDAEFRNWVRRQVGFDAERRQGHMTMGVAGGAKDTVGKPAAFEAFDPATAFDPVTAAQWLRVQRRLRDHIGSSDYRVWLSGMTLGAIDGDTVTICLPNSYLRDRARGNYTSWLTAAWRQERPEISEITAVVPAREQRTAEA